MASFTMGSGGTTAAVVGESTKTKVLATNMLATGKKIRKMGSENRELPYINLRGTSKMIRRMALE